MLSRFIRRRRKYRLFCKRMGKWELVDELDEKINWAQAKDIYDLEEECEAAQLREYEVISESEDRYRRAVWTKNIRKRQVTVEDQALAALAVINQIMDTCQMLQRLVGGSQGSQLDAAFAELIRHAIGQRLAAAAGGQPQAGQRIVEAEPSPEALEVIRREAEAFAETEPCEECVKEARRKLGEGAGER